MTEQSVIWTIGHSNHSMARFKDLLAAEGIQFIADVRSYPFSRFAPHFNSEELEQRMEESDVRYLFLGDALGGRPESEDQYDDEGHALYGRMAEEPQFDAAVGRLLDGASTYRIALLCSEGKPQDCHRRLLVGKVLTDRGVALRHILPDGTVVHEDAVNLGPGQQQIGLFQEAAPVWRSTQSVSHRRRLRTSSAV